MTKTSCLVIKPQQRDHIQIFHFITGNFFRAREERGRFLKRGEIQSKKIKTDRRRRYNPIYHELLNQNSFRNVVEHTLKVACPENTQSVKSHAPQARNGFELPYQTKLYF